MSRKRNIHVSLGDGPGRWKVIRGRRTLSSHRKQADGGEERHSLRQARTC